MRSISTSLLTLTTAALLCGPSSVDAQESTTRGLSVGLHFGGASLSIESQDRNDAGGGGLSIGYGINRNFTIFGQADAAQFDAQSSGEVVGDWTLAHVDLGVRYYFANSLRRWVPYLQAALGFRSVSVKDPVVNGTQRGEVEISGSGLSLGGGLDFYVSQSFALDLQLMWTGGEFNTIRVDNVSQTGFDFDATSGRFNLGVVWWP